MHRISICALALALAGCAAAAGPPLPQTIEDLPPTEWRAKLAAHVKASFKDPSSIRDAAIAAAPVPEMVPAQVQHFMRPRWVVCFAANARNGFGGYNGLTVYQATFRGDQVLSVHPARDMGATCNGVQLHPFPEINGAGV